MAAKPTQDPKWVTSDDPNEIIEPSPALKTNGVQSGGIWGREHLNWMFNSLSKWIDWVRSSAMDKDNNLNDVADKPSAFNNIKQNATTTSTGVVEAATSAETTSGTSNKFPDAAKVKEVTDTKLTKSSNLSDVGSTTTAFNNIKQNATTTSTGVVEKATDIETEAGTSGKFPDAASIASKFLKKSDNLSSVSNPSAAFNNIKQNATTTSTGVVEKATDAETESGTSGKFPDAASISSKFLKKSDNLSSVANKITSFDNIKQTATTSYTGVVEKATSSEMISGAADKFPDAATIQQLLPTALKSAQGYWRCNNSGVILQWGTRYVGFQSYSPNTAFPISFPNACFAMVVSDLNPHFTSQYDASVGAKATDKTQYRVWTNDVATTVQWFAVGY